MDSRTRINMDKVYDWKDRLNNWNGWTVPALIELILGAAGELDGWNEPEGVAVLSASTMMLGHHGVNLWLPTDKDVVDAFEKGKIGSITILEDNRDKDYPEHVYVFETQEGKDDPIVKRFMRYLADADDDYCKQYKMVGRNNPIETDWRPN